MMTMNDKDNNDNNDNNENNDDDDDDVDDDNEDDDKDDSNGGGCMRLFQLTLRFDRIMGDAAYAWRIEIERGVEAGQQAAQRRRQLAR